MPEEAKKGLRLKDLLDGKTLILVLDWRTSDAGYLDVLSIESPAVIQSAALIA
jgi:hypothetical protein